MLRALLTTAGAALVLGPVALITPLASPAASVPDGYPAGTTLAPGRLDRGPNTPLLHVAETVVVDGDLRVPLERLDNVWLLQRVGPDYLVQASNSDFTRYAVVLVHPDGTRRVLRRFTDPTLVSASADGRRLALVTSTRTSTLVRVVTTRTGDLVARHTFGANDVEVSDYGPATLVASSYAIHRTWRWNPDSGRVTAIARRLAWADIAADRLVLLRPNPDNPDLFCQRTVRLSQPTEVLWRSCQDTPGVFSPSGRRMITWYINTDGLGPALVQVRRIDGTVLRTYRAAWGFGFSVWESNRSVLLQPYGAHRAAAVRCDVLTGECERASRLYRVPTGGPPLESMRWSFPQ
jgi:hypothetical protein